MTLQEKIQNKAEEYGQLAPAFLEGAKFALANRWISVEDDLPCNHEELIDKNYKDSLIKTLFVIALRDNKHQDFTFMVLLNGEWRWLDRCSYTHWMPIPELPKEQED